MSLGLESAVGIPIELVAQCELTIIQEEMEIVPQVPGDRDPEMV
jgi:hypothetical protein